VNLVAAMLGPLCPRLVLHHPKAHRQSARIPISARQPIPVATRHHDIDPRHRSSGTLGREQGELRIPARETFSMDR
jgi:hypothetical protein